MSLVLGSSLNGISILKIFNPILKQMTRYNSQGLMLPGLDIDVMNRNARKPNLANHGARPCSSVMRRLKKKGFYRRWKEKLHLDNEDINPKHGHIQDEESR